MICGYLPFEDPNTSQLYKKILNAEYHAPNFISEEARDILAKILNTDPETRFTIDQIRDHPWFNIVECSQPHQGVVVGIDPEPIDPSILNSIASFDIDVNYARKCLEANKHNHISATYHLLLKKHIFNGGESIADVASPKYDPRVFLRRHPHFNNLKTVSN